MAARKTLGQKKKARDAAFQTALRDTKSRPKTPIEVVRDRVNARLAGRGNVYTGADIREEMFERRPSGIPAIDYILHGGYARGGLHEFGGEYSTCKTTIALTALAHNQRTENGAVAWIALEPFSKAYARKVGFFLPFSEELQYNPVTEKEEPVDSFSRASEEELYQMEKAGITDPYGEVTPVVFVREERGDVALDAALDCIRSNAFAYVVVDSLGVAKSTSWVDEGDVQGFSDFPREPKMIGDYTTRAVLALNRRYDENGHEARDGKVRNSTTVIHLNQITTVVNANGARAKHKTQSIKGGEGNKHNHHAIVFLSKGPDLQVEGPHGTTYRYARDIRAYTLKSKLGPDGLDAEFRYFMRTYGTMHPHQFDTAADLATFGIMFGLIQQSGAYYTLDEASGLRIHGRDNLNEYLRDNPDWYAYLYDALLPLFGKNK